MSQDDPFASFGDEDRTVIRPTPGGRRPNRPSTDTQPPPPPSPTGPGPAFQMPELSSAANDRAGFGDNPFVTSAATLFSLVARLRSTPTHNHIAELQQQLAHEVRGFENRLLQQGVLQDKMRLGSYALCSLLDETVLNTPWGAQSFWGQQTLLSVAHRETYGGEKFFQFLEGMERQPAENLPLIEFFWLCLSLGFKGKFGIMQNGLNQLEQVRNNTFTLIERYRGPAERDFSPRWQGLRDVRNPLIRFVPLWVIGAAAGLLTLLMYIGFAFFINDRSDPVARDLFMLAREEPKALAPTPGLPAAPKPAPGKAERFRPLLGAELAQNMVEIVDDRILRIRNSFDSGSDRVKQSYLPMFGKIAVELKNGKDNVLVTGHTDDKPIFSARFPSNFELSTARAKNVSGVLISSGLAPTLVRAEGRADYEPLVPNDTPEHRAINRRVDILIQ